MNKLPRILTRTVSSKGSLVVGYVIIAILSSLFLLSSRGQAGTDRMIDLIRSTQTREEVAIIGIDDASLKEFGAWPWNRSVFADLTKALDGYEVRVSAYDILFFEPREGDDYFREVLSQVSHPVLLAAKVEAGEFLSSYLISGTSSSITSALANVYPDTDGKVRMYPSGSTHNGTCVLSLSEAAFAIYTKRQATCTVHKDQFRYPENIATYSLVDVVRGTVSQESLRGKVVFIGSTSLGLEDHFMGIRGSKVPGVYVHASAFTSYLNEVSDTKIPHAIAVLLLLLVMTLSVLILYVIERTLLQLAAIISLVFMLGVASVIFYEMGHILPLPALLFAALATAGYTGLVRFLEERKQNLFIEQIFSKYVHKDILKEIIASGKEVKLGGERKHLTVLFSDIRGFTTLSESLSPEDLTSILNEYLSEMTPHILQEKGTIDKFIGDAIMAFWNAPLAVHNHEHHAVRAALAMHDALARFNRAHGTSLAAGIGIHTGFAVVGNVGGKDRVNYTILGDTVNLASRLEGLTKKYGISTLVTMPIKDAITDPAIEFRCLDVITVAGKSTPTTLYEARRAGEFGETLVKDYEKALKNYYEGQWNKAEQLFKKLAKEGDAPSEKMLARIPELRKRSDWDGVWRFDEK